MTYRAGSTSEDMCRTYGAQERSAPCTLSFRSGLRSFAPPALYCKSQIRVHFKSEHHPRLRRYALASMIAASLKLTLNI